MNYILIFALLLGTTCPICQGAGDKHQIIAYPPVPTAIKSDIYQVKVNSRETASQEPIDVFVQKFKDIHYAHFAIPKQAVKSDKRDPAKQEPIDIIIEVAEPIKKYSVSPESYLLPCSVCDNHLHILIRQPRKLVIQINDYPRLFIFADAIEDDRPAPDNPNVINIMDFVGTQRGVRPVDNTGTTLITQKIQKAIRSTPSGGTLYFPPGVYLTGTIRLKSNMTLYLAAGALLQGSPDVNDYPLDEGRTEAGTHGDMTYSRLILIDNAQNVTITGAGTIDGNGKIIRAAGRNANLIRIRNCQNILIENVILRDPAAWNTHILHSKNVTIKNVKIINDRTVGNTDGINPDSSSNVLIENNFAYCGDDSIAIKTTGNSDLLADVNNITVAANILLTRKSALKIGTETLANHIQNVTFIDNDIIECDRGMTIYCKDGAIITNIRYINNRFESCFLNNRQRMLDFYIKKRAGLGQIRNILIKDCRFKTFFPQSSTIAGYDQNHIISDIRFENFYIAGKPCPSAQAAKLQINKYVRNVTFQVTSN